MIQHRSRCGNCAASAALFGVHQMRHILIIGSCLLFIAPSAIAAVTEFTNKLQWQNAVGAYATITFSELPVNTLVTTQYSLLGATFIDGSDYIDEYSITAYPNDGYGLNAAFDETTLVFSQPMYTIAADFPGHVIFKLYFDQHLIYTSSDFGGFGSGHFGGIISDQPFNSVFIYDQTGGLFIDDLHFGPPIPAPGALALLGLAACIGRPRRRR